MVEIKAEHKANNARIATTNSTIVDWYTPEGEWGEVDIKDIETSDLWILRKTIEDFMRSQLSVIDEELNNWSTIYCSVCGQEDLAHRGYPFITWGVRGGYTLCPRHLRAFDLKGTPEGDLLDAAKKEQREIAELFG
jgi:hypothetical protein